MPGCCIAVQGNGAPATNTADRPPPQMPTQESEARQLFMWRGYSYICDTFSLKAQRTMKGTV